MEGLEYIWIDTCCIDKSSSAELSEALNSMYPWYQKAQICYAYLADVPASVDTSSMDSEFGKSRWVSHSLASLVSRLFCSSIVLTHSVELVHPWMDTAGAHSVLECGFLLESLD